MTSGPLSPESERLVERGHVATDRALAPIDRVRASVSGLLGALRARANRRLTTADATVVLLGLLSIVFARAPILLLEPRLWAEEATVHLAYAWKHGWWEVLSFVPVDHGPAGYLNLAPNLASLAATRLFELEQAPLVFTGVAMIVQLLPLVVVLYGRSAVWASAWQQVLAAAVLLFTPVITGEVWLNTVNSQLFCGVLALVLLCEPTDGLGRMRRWAYRCALALSGLTGVYAAALAPAFLLRQRRRGDRESRIQALILIAAASLQLVCIGLTHGLLDPQRSGTLRAEWGQILTAILYHHFFRPVFGYTVSGRIFTVLGLRPAAGSSYLPNVDVPSSYLVLAGWVSLAALLGFFLWCGRRRLGEPLILLAVALACLETVLLTSLVGILPAGRYAVVPGVAVLLILLVVSVQDRSGARKLAGAAIATALLIGIATFHNDVPRGSLSAQFPGRPSWRQEVAAWRTDPGDDLQVWPSALSASGPVLPGIFRWTIPLARDRAPRSWPPPGTAMPHDVQLVTTGPWELRSYPTGGLPADFRLTFDLLSSHSDGVVDLRLRFEGEQGEILAERRLSGFVAERSLHVRIDRLGDPGLLALAPGRVSAVTFAMQPAARAPTRVKILGFRVSERVEGLVDSLLRSDR